MMPVADAIPGGRTTFAADSSLPTLSARFAFCPRYLGLRHPQMTPKNANCADIR